MNNILQPYVNLTNANIETFLRFANSREITDLAKTSAVKLVEAAQENVSKVAGSDAFASWTRAAIDNYVRFANEYTQNVYGIVSKSQEFVSRQVEEGNRRFAQIAELSGRAAEEGLQAVKSSVEVKSSGEEALTETEQQLSRARQQRSK